jgi:hypothetical protein
MSLHLLFSVFSNVKSFNRTIERTSGAPSQDSFTNSFDLPNREIGVHVPTRKALGLRCDGRDNPACAV